MQCFRNLSCGVKINCFHVLLHPTLSYGVHVDTEYVRTMKDRPINACKMYLIVTYKNIVKVKVKLTL